MPFIGQDWRSPGDRWVRTTEGWERLKLWRVKIFENLNQNAVARLLRLAVEDENRPQQDASRRQPHIFFNSGASKEKLELTSLSEAIVRLDIAGAAKDLRRANYVIRLMALIFEEKLPALSGTSQKLVFNILESLVNEAVASELNIGLAKHLLQHARAALLDGRHRHIGSPALWEGHMDTVERLTNKITQYQIKERDIDGRVMLSDLPSECLRIIFSQIPDHKDVMRAGQTNTTLNEVTEERSLWRAMCIHHFSDMQISTFVASTDNQAWYTVDWKYIYRRCYKRFGRKESYADMLAICSHCCGIHWKSLGHPCVGEEKFEAKSLEPQEFLSLFKL